MNNRFHLKTRYCDKSGCSFYTRHYAKGGIYIGIQSDSEYGPEPWMDVTVNLGNAVPAGMIAVKSYSENEGLLEFLQELGFITRIYKTVDSGFVEVPVCEYSETVLKKYCAEPERDGG